ncbi:MAG: YeeE/YedE family protein [Hyphomicrobiaceae bacterium]
MFEELGLEGWTPQQASVVIALMLGAAFGILAQRSRFCLRRGLIGTTAERRAAAGIWSIALSAAIAGTGIASAIGLIDFAEHRFHADELPVLAILAGGLMFGAGATLSRGCASRLTVLAGSGNLRAWTVLLVFAVFAQSTMKGLLAPIRQSMTSMRVELGEVGSLAGFPGGEIVWGGLLVVGLTVVALRSGAGMTGLAMGAGIGLLVPLAWLSTGFLLADEFDPIALDGLAFTAPAADTLSWILLSSAIAPGFGVGLFVGVLAGALLAALSSSEFQWQGFTAETPNWRYLFGGALMGSGGILAGGCTVGSGLSGVSTLSIAGILALLSIAAGIWLTDALLARSRQDRVASDLNRIIAPSAAE